MIKKNLLYCCSIFCLLSNEGHATRHLIEGAEAFYKLSKSRVFSFSTYKIHPSIGLARLGDSDEFYVAPSSIGGLPTIVDNAQKNVESFKDCSGKIKKQAAHFKIYKDGKPLDKSDSNIQSIEWKAYLANKKAAWWNFNEFCGDLMLDTPSRPNTYEFWSQQNEPKAGGFSPIMTLRNSSIKGKDRNNLIINPGSRTVNYSSRTADFNVKGFEDINPYAIKTLGKMQMNADNSLFVLGGNGFAGGRGAKITGFGGADGWFDDTSDGPVEAKIKFKDGSPDQYLRSWVVVGSPKYAPGLVNITTWDDTLLDMSVRYFNTYPDIFDKDSKKFKLGASGYWPSFEEDILPIFHRMRNYEWVANVGPMVFFSQPHFDIRDNRQENRQNRRDWFNYLRAPVDLSKSIEDDFVISPAHNLLYKNDGYPLMPLNSGDNSVRNQNVSKFVTLSPLQYYMFYQWSEGFFRSGTESEFLKKLNLNHLDRASVGNCVGYPMSPGIEVTWSTRNPKLYEPGDFYRLKQSRLISEFDSNGLNPDRDETVTDEGCEPGDLTKRMAIPWQADFLNCSVQNVNYTISSQNKDSNGNPIKPTYYSYWWPAQAPWDVYTSNDNEKSQSQDGNPSGVKVNFQRGISDYPSMMRQWSSLGFIVNQNKNARLKDHYPYFVEQERNLGNFKIKSVGLTDDGNVYLDGFSEAQDLVTQNIYYSPNDDSKKN